MRSIAVVLALLAATPQQPKLPFIGESIEVSIVNVDVFVTDKAGKRVTGLTQNDFEIYEDGKLRPITNFAEYANPASVARVSVEGVADSSAQPTAAAAAPEVAKRQQRTIAIFVDRLEMRPDQEREVFDRLRSTLHDLVDEGDRVSVITWERTRSLRIRQPYTGDLNLIGETLSKIAEDPTLSSSSELEEIRKADEAEAEREAMLKARGAPSGGGGEASMEAIMLSDHALAEMKSKTAALNALLSSMSGAEGQKVLVMLSHRFSLNPAHEFLTPKRTIGAPPTPLEMRYDTRKEVESVAHTANANGVRIYAMYPAALPATVVQSPEDNSMPQGGEAGVGGYDFEVLHNELNALQTITERTGGAMTWHPSETIKLLDRLPDDFSSYYSLAYRASTSGADKAHSIKVKVKTPGLTVRSRTEFVEKSAESKMGERVVAQLLGLPTPPTHVRLLATANGAKRDSKKKVNFPLNVQVPIGALTTLPEGAANRGAFSVYVVSMNGRGNISEVTHQTQVYTIPAADLARAKQGHFTYELNFVGDETTKKLAVGVLDEVSKEFGLTQLDVQVR